MDYKLCLVALLLALAVAVEASMSSEGGWRFAPKSVKSHDAGWGLSRYSHGSSVGDVIGEDNEMMLDSKSTRRTLADQQRYISYGALKRNGIPCTRRGVSYYNCGQPKQQANTYRRGCTYITRCARRNY